MAPAIRGHQGRIKVFKNGKNASIVNIVSATVDQDSDFSRSFYVGNTIGEGDQVMNGWSGSMDLEVKDSAVDDFIDALIEQNLAGIGVEEITVVMEEHYTNGVVVPYVYFDVQAKMSKSQPNMTAKVTKKLDWQASGRARL